MKDYYSILGVHRASTEAEIKRAYRRLALLYHPDKNADPKAQQLFVEINEAYDIIGDASNRQTYNYKLDNSFSEILEEQIKPPTHRDPAYRRRNATTSRGTKQFSDTYYLMRDYLKYIRWVGWIGLAASSLFFIDYVLPYKKTEEKIIEIYEVRGPRNSTAYDVVVTESGRKIKLYNGLAGIFFNEAVIVGAYSMIYTSPMWISKTGSEAHPVRLAYMYGGLMLFPLVLFILSILGIIYKNKIEFCFNLNLVSGVLLIIFLILL